MNFGHDAQKLGSFDISGLKAAVAAFGDEAWTADASRQAAFNAHASTQTLKLIADSDFRHTDPTYHAAFEGLEAHLLPLMAHIRAYYLQTMRQRRVAEQYGPGYFIRALLTRLPPGAEIKPHIDDGESLKRCHRIHGTASSRSATCVSTWAKARCGKSTTGGSTPSAMTAARRAST
jgi:hypothetical protein